MTTNEHHAGSEMPGRYVLEASGAQPLSVLSDTYGFDDAEHCEEAGRIAFPRQRKETNSKLKAG